MLRHGLYLAPVLAYVHHCTRAAVPRVQAPEQGRPEGFAWGQQHDEARYKCDGEILCIFWDQDWCEEAVHSLPIQQLHDIFPNMVHLHGGHWDNWKLALAHLHMLGCTDTKNLAKIQHHGLALPQELFAGRRGQHRVRHS
jgi:hypothetical protein